MSIEYVTFHSIPADDVLEGIIALHKEIFGNTDNLKTKMNTKPNLVIMTAMDGQKVVGYKLGYELDQQTFYSWLGGVDAQYRKQGIASELMEKQHQYVKGVGYRVVQTKTMNQWRHMLLLNIKQGFDVMETYTDAKGVHKIILEKKL
jgi:predicted GNAT family acetyltransferase